MRRLILVAAMAAAGPVLAGTVTAGIESAVRTGGTGWVDTDGTFTIKNPPSNLTSFAQNQPKIWLERKLLTPNLSYLGIPAGGTLVDWLGGTDALNTSFAQVPGTGVSLAPVLRVLPAGTPVNSYYFYSNRNNGGGGNNYSGNITFKLPIVGVIIRNNLPAVRLSSADSSFGQPGVSGYPSGAPALIAGFDLNSTDRFSVEKTASGWKLNFQIGASGFDNFRILTATPEPAAWAAFAMVAVTLLAAAWRRKAAAEAR